VSDPEEPGDSDPSGGPNNLAAPPSDTPTPTPTPTPTIPPTATFTPTPTAVPCVAEASDDELDFGDDGTSLPLTISVNDCGGGPVDFVVGGSESWITSDPGGGTIMPGGVQEFVISVDRDDLSPDTYEEQVQVVSSLGNLVIPIVVEVEPPPCEVDISATTLAFGTVNAPETEAFEISLNDCGETTTFEIGMSREAAAWITVDPIRGSLGPGDSVEIEVSVDPGPMPPGPHAESLTISTDFGTFDVRVTACRLVPGGPACR